MKDITFVVVKDLQCPHCGSPEMHPSLKDSVLIRGFKVQLDDGHWYSQCLVCAGYYDENLQVRPETERPADWRSKGWF